MTFARQFFLLVLATAAVVGSMACSDGASGLLGQGSGDLVTVRMTAATGTSPAGVIEAALARAPSSGAARKTIDAGSSAADGATSVAAATITVTSVRVRETDGPWHDLTSLASEPIDLLQILDSGLSIAAGTLPPGSYDTIGVTIASASIVLDDGTSLEMTLPPGGVDTLVPITLEVVEGQDATVTLRFDVDVSIKAIDGGLTLEPAIECEGIEHEGGDD